jgi:transcriptional regulator with XRE-family HTH domain
MSAPRRTTEEYVPENWPAVAKAINERMTELGLQQKELASKSGVSLAIVREVQHNVVERRRSARTLEALAVALQWHPQHLLALMHDRKPPAPGEPREDMRDPVTARLAIIEDRLTEITEQLAALRAEVASLGNREAR